MGFSSWIVAILSPWYSPRSPDLATSIKLLQPLPLSAATKDFVVALPLPDQPSLVVYLLAAHYLSEKSASDAASLVKCVAPHSVIAQIDPDNLPVLRVEQQIAENGNPNPVPTSAAGIVRGCFMEQKTPSAYENLAGAQAMSSIFGTNFFGYVFAAKQAAAEAGSSFAYLVTPRRFDHHLHQADENPQHVINRTDLSDLSSGKGIRHFSSENGRNQFTFTRTAYLEETKSLAVSASSLLTENQDLHESSSVDGIDSGMKFECPSYALSFYPLLPVLQEGFDAIPRLRNLLPSAQSVLLDVQNGRQMDEAKLAQACMFRVGMEAIRWQLNARAQNPNILPLPASIPTNFEELDYEDKCHIVLAQALQREARKGQTVVAILEGGSIEGIRKYWNTPDPELSALAEGCFITLEDEEEEDNAPETMEGLSAGVMEKPVVVVGAGAAAAMGLSSLSKILHASPLVKILTVKIPTALKAATAPFSVSKAFIPSSIKSSIPIAKAVHPSKFFWMSGSKASLGIKSIGSGESVRATASNITSAATRASLSAIRTAFYGLMRTRQGKSAGSRPWLTLGGSILTGGAVLYAGDRLESGIEALQVAPYLARLGRGLQNLHTAADALKQTEHPQALNRVYDLLYSISRKQH